MIPLCPRPLPALLASSYTPRLTFSKRVFTLRSNLGVFTGMYLQMMASMEPVIAIQTTEIAAGTLASNEPKCSFANRKPNADDFMDVSMAIVREDTSEKPMYLGTWYSTVTQVKSPNHNISQDIANLYFRGNKIKLFFVVIQQSMQLRFPNFGRLP